MRSPSRPALLAITGLLGGALNADAAPHGHGRPPHKKPAPPVPPDEARDRADILDVLKRMQNAWNIGDFHGYMAGFKNPGVVFVSGGHFQTGWKTTLDRYVRNYGRSTQLRGSLRFYDTQIELLGPDCAQLVTRYELYRPQHPQYGINTDLMRKIDGHWVITLNHVSGSDTPPSDQERVAWPAHPALDPPAAQETAAALPAT